MKLADLLKAARSKIDAPEKWTRECYARGEDGFYADMHGADAVCFCAMGAVRSLIPNSPSAWFVGDYVRNFINNHLPEGYRSIPAFNDNLDTTHADVLALFDRAIAAAEQEVLSV